MWLYMYKMCKGMCNHSVQNGYDTKGSAHRNISEVFYIYHVQSIYTCAWFVHRDFGMYKIAPEPNTKCFESKMWYIRVWETSAIENRS